MPKCDLHQKVVDLPLFRQPDHHQRIWNHLSKHQVAQIMKLVSKMLLEYQKFQGEYRDE